MAHVVSAYISMSLLYLRLCPDSPDAHQAHDTAAEDYYNTHPEYNFPALPPISFPGDTDAWQRYCVQHALYVHAAYAALNVSSVPQPHLVG